MSSMHIPDRVPCSVVKKLSRAQLEELVSNQQSFQPISGALLEAINKAEKGAKLEH